MRILILAMLMAATPAAADHPREQGLMFGVLTGGGAFIDGNASPDIQFGLNVAWVIDSAATVAIGVALDGSENWRTTRHEKGAASVLLSIWVSDHASISLGAGTPVGVEASTATGGGIAGFARVGYDLVHWHRNALVLRAGVDGDNTPGDAGLQVAVTIGIDGFGLGQAQPGP